MVPDVSSPATINRRTPDYTTVSDIGHRLLDMSGCIAAMTKLQSCDIVRRRTTRDQDGPSLIRKHCRRQFSFNAIN